jgi:hypothetical protein
LWYERPWMLLLVVLVLLVLLVVLVVWKGLVV